MGIATGFDIEADTDPWFTVPEFRFPFFYFNSAIFFTADFICPELSADILHI